MLKIRVIKITKSNVYDALELPELLDQMLSKVRIGSITEIGPCETIKCS